MQLYRSEFEKKFYKLKDSECPGKPSFEDLCEQIDGGEFRAMALRHFGSRAEEDEAETGNLQVGKTGQVRIKKSRVETSEPANMEDFRSKITLVVNHLIFARFRYPHKQVLDGISLFTSIEYLNYICSKNVAQLESVTIDDVPLHRPSLKLIMSYEFQMRKEAVDEVNKGMAWTQALREVVKNADVRERYFSTPLAVSSASQAYKEPWGERSRAKDRQRPYGQPSGEKGKSKGKGKRKKGKGKAKGRGSALHAVTPDGRQLCFAWNNPQEGCEGGCNRVHACRICLDTSHPSFDPSDSKDS